MSDENGIATPTGWFKARASEVCEKIQDGTHFSPKVQLAVGRYPYVTAKNVRPSGLDLRDITYLSERDHREIYARCDCRKGDVLLVKDGVNTGDAAINSLDGEVSLLSSVCMLRPRAGVLDAGFLRYYLQSPQCAPFLLGGMTGTAIRRIILKRIKALPVLACPIREQREIVATIESYFTRLDDAVATLERVRRNLKRYRASVLKAAVEGRLVPTEAELARAEGRSYEPASVLLTRILAERRRRWEEAELAKMTAKGRAPKDDKWKAKYVEPFAPDTSDLPELPDGWCWATVDQLAIVGTGATPKRSDARFWSGGDVPWVTSAVVNDSLVTTASEFVTNAALRETNLTLYPPGTLLIAMYGEGKTRGRATTLGIPSATNQALAALELPGRSDQLRGWLLRFLEHNYLELRRAASGGVQPNLNLGIVRAICVPVPPVSEQRRVSEEADRSLSIAHAMFDAVIANELKVIRLRQSLLKWAFEGRLVDQDPTDEPASALLERIRAEQASVHEPTLGLRGRTGRPGPRTGGSSNSLPKPSAV